VAWNPFFEGFGDDFFSVGPFENHFRPLFRVFRIVDGAVEQEHADFDHCTFGNGGTRRKVGEQAFVRLGDVAERHLFRNLDYF